MSGTNGTRPKVNEIGSLSHVENQENLYGRMSVKPAVKEKKHARAASMCFTSDRGKIKDVRERKYVV